MSRHGRCFACDRPLGHNPAIATCADEQNVLVGSDCMRQIVKAGREGYQPNLGGPKLYSLTNDPKRAPDAPPRTQQELAALHRSAVAR